jgi:hypothetical protein
MNILAKSRASEVVLEAKITRADGRVEYLGEIAHYYRSPLRRLVWRCKSWLR